MTNRIESARHGALRRVTLLPGLFAALVVLAGCGDWGEKSPSQPAPSPSVQVVAPASQAAASALATSTHPVQDFAEGDQVTPAVDPTIMPAVTVTSVQAIEPHRTAQPQATEVRVDEPPRLEQTYVVQPGDTLGDLSVRFDVSIEEIAAANGIDPGAFLYIDQTLKIPAAAAGTGEAPSSPPLSGQTSGVPVPTSTKASRIQPTVVAPAPPVKPTPAMVNGRTYDAYIPAVIKSKQWFQYTCEFDAAWVVLKTYGFDVGLERQIELVGLDTSIEPYYKETKSGAVVYGGDITNFYSGNYKKNFLGRSTGQAMRKVFDAYNLRVTPVSSRDALESALLRGELVWIKTTVDFKAWRPVTWVMPDGRTTKGVLGNDHALVVMGFNKDGVVVRDPLGPTSTNWNRKYEYEVPWSRFMAAWEAQNYDGLAVAPPGR